MKLLRLAIVLVLLCWLVSNYAMTPDDLTGGEVVAKGKCYHFGELYHCVAVEKNGDIYLVLFTSEKNIAVYKVKEVKSSYHPHEMELVWSNKTI